MFIRFTARGVKYRSYRALSTCPRSFLTVTTTAYLRMSVHATTGGVPARGAVWAATILTSRSTSPNSHDFMDTAGFMQSIYVAVLTRC